MCGVWEGSVCPRNEEGRVTVVSLAGVIGGDRRWKEGRKDDGGRKAEGGRKEVEGGEGVVNDFD